MRNKLKKLLDTINVSIEKSERFAKEAHKAASEIGRAAAASPSQSGDREHARNQAAINKQNLEKLLKVGEEIQSGLSKELGGFVEIPCYLTLEFDDGRHDEFYILQTPVHLDRYKIVSSQSPLGQTLIGKKVGEDFKYQIESDLGILSKSGKVVSIE